MYKVSPSCPVHRGNMFTWNGDAGVVDASDLGPFGHRWYDRVYDDACDLGFVVVSHRTGARVLFIFDDSFALEHNTWRFNGRTRDGRELTITVFND